MSRYADWFPDSVSYKDAVDEMVRTLDAMRVGDAPIGDSRNKRNMLRVDLSFLGDDQTQFILSPAQSPASAPRDSFPFAGGGLGYIEDYKVSKDNSEDRLVPASDPDLGWVNELLT